MPAPPEIFELPATPIDAIVSAPADPMIVVAPLPGPFVSVKPPVLAEASTVRTVASSASEIVSSLSPETLSVEGDTPEKLCVANVFATD